MSVQNNKPKIALGVCGNVDAGKSTLSGQLLLLTGYTSEHEQRKLQQLAVKTKDASFQYAFKMDKLKQQRQRGVTIKQTVVEFNTPNRQFIISDLPGHSLFTKNFLVGSSQLDLVLLLIDVNEGVVEQTKSHLRIVLGNGVKSVIVVVNKMDSEPIQYSETKFRQIETQFKKLVGDRLTYLQILPISAFEGQNVLKNTKMPWYTGKTLYETLDEVPQPVLETDASLRFLVSEVISKTGIGVIVQGKVSRGTLNTNSEIIVKPSNKKYEVKSIESFHRSVKTAYINQSVGITLRGLQKEDIKKGYIISDINDSPLNAKGLTLEVTVINPQVTLRQASDLLLSSGTIIVAAKIVKIRQIRDKLGEIKYDHMVSTESSKKQTIVRSESATIEVVLAKVIPIETGQKNPRLGVCKLLNERGLVASAVVMDILVDSSDK